MALNLVRRASRRLAPTSGPIATKCMVRALTRYVLMRELGLDAAYVMGVRTEDDGDLVGHAWIEYGGAPVWEGEVAQYEVTFRFPEVA